MECPDWRTLPAEVLLNIFQFSPAKQLTNTALVCKTWKNPAQSTLYTHVTIFSFMQLEKFYGIIECNSHFGTKVRTLNLKIIDRTHSNQANIIDILSTLLCKHLPNLESFNQKNFFNYVPILNALLKFKLPHLTKIPHPGHLLSKDDFTHYASCAYLMRNGLEKVYITDGQSNLYKEDINRPALIKFQQLYDNLDEFNNLVKIDIRRRTDDAVQTLEYIVEACRSLRYIKLELFSIKSQNSPLQNNISLDSMSYRSPKPNIKVLRVYLCLPTLDSCKILLYIIQKFPQLQDLRLIFDEILQITPYVAIQLLNYLLKVNNIFVYNLALSQIDVDAVFENFWNTKSKPGIEIVELIYSYGYHDNRVTLLNVDRNNKDVNYSLNTFLPTLDWQPYMDFIEKNGKFIGDLTFKLHNFDNKLPENFLVHMLTHCPNLRKINIYGCSLLDKCVNSEVGCSNKYFIDELTLVQCDTEPAILEQLSKVLFEIKQLKLTDFSSHNSQENDDVIRFSMPYTKIDLIIWDPSYYDGITCVKIFVVTDETCYHYKFQSGVSELINEKIFEELENKKVSDEEYDEYNFNETQFVYICCQTKPDFKVNYE